MNEAGRVLVLLAVLLTIIAGISAPTTAQIIGGPAANPSVQPEADDDPSGDHDQAVDEAIFLGLINELRTELGLPILEVHPELAAEARDWTTLMADSDRLAHAGDITSNITAPWTTLGENVGVHKQHEIQELFDAFVTSPDHYENLVDPRYRYVGIGVERREGGGLWTTHRFMAVAGDNDSGRLSPPQHPILTRGTQLIG